MGNVRWNCHAPPGKPLTLGKAPSEPISVSQVMHPTEWAVERPFHDIKVWGGRFNDFKKHHVQQTYFGHFYNCIDHHQKIIPYNVDQVT